MAADISIAIQESHSEVPRTDLELLFQTPNLALPESRFWLNDRSENSRHSEISRPKSRQSGIWSNLQCVRQNTLLDFRFPKKQGRGHFPDTCFRFLKLWICIPSTRHANQIPLTSEPLIGFWQIQKHQFQSWIWETGWLIRHSSKQHWDDSAPQTNHQTHEQDDGDGRKFSDEAELNWSVSGRLFLTCRYFLVTLN